METVRLFLHVLSATVWVGGQLVLAAVVPALRAVDAQAPRAAARAYNRIAWPAFGILVATGIWNVAAAGDEDGAYATTLTVKMALVTVSGVAAYLHTRATSAGSRGLLGAASALAGVVALLLGIVLAE